MTLTMSAMWHSRARRDKEGRKEYLGHALDQDDEEAFAQVLFGRPLGHKVVRPVPAAWTLRFGHTQHCAQPTIDYHYVSIKMLFIQQINHTANKHNGDYYIDYYIDFMRGIEE